MQPATGQHHTEAPTPRDGWGRLFCSDEEVRAILAGEEIRRPVPLWPISEGQAQLAVSPFAAASMLHVCEAWQADFDLPGTSGFPFFHQTPPAFRGPQNARYVYYRADGAILHAPVSAWESEPWESRISGPEDTGAETAARLAREDRETLARMHWLEPSTMPRWAVRMRVRADSVGLERGEDGWCWVARLSRIVPAPGGEG
jgi:hypothetical protein